jgi:hypothetical protein
VVEFLPFLVSAEEQEGGTRGDVWRDKQRQLIFIITNQDLGSHSFFMNRSVCETLLVKLGNL